MCEQERHLLGQQMRAYYHCLLATLHLSIAHAASQPAPGVTYAPRQPALDVAYGPVQLRRGDSWQPDGQSLGKNLPASDSEAFELSLPSDDQPLGEGPSQYTVSFKVPGPEHSLDAVALSDDGPLQETDIVPQQSAFPPAVPGSAPLMMPTVSSPGSLSTDQCSTTSDTINWSQASQSSGRIGYPGGYDTMVQIIHTSPSDSPCLQQLTVRLTILDLYPLYQETDLYVMLYEAHTSPGVKNLVYGQSQMSSNVELLQPVLASTTGTLQPLVGLPQNLVVKFEGTPKLKPGTTYAIVLTSAGLQNHERRVSIAYTYNADDTSLVGGEIFMMDSENTTANLNNSWDAVPFPVGGRCQNLHCHIDFI